MRNKRIRNRVRLWFDAKLLRRRLHRAERLLRWVDDDADLSGQMELSAAIKAFLAEI